MTVADAAAAPASNGLMKALKWTFTRFRDKASLPIALLVLVDLVTFGAIVLSAVAVDYLLQRLRGGDPFFYWTRVVADAVLSLLALVFVVEGVVSAVFEAAYVIRERWIRLSKASND
jgi:hypothetical protein